MMILALDPGISRCGVVLYDGRTHEVCRVAVVPPKTAISIAAGLTGEDGGCLSRREWPDVDRCVIEHIGHYGTGMPAGKETFDTCVLIGRMAHAWDRTRPSPAFSPAHLLLRPAVKTYLCRKRNATDANVRHAILDRFPRTGGGATPQVGTKRQPGPLYGVSGDAWQALALAITYAETELGLPPLRVEIAP